MRQQKAAKKINNVRKPEGARTPKTPRTTRQVLAGNVYSINGHSSGVESPTQEPEQKVSEAEAASGPCACCGNKTLPWGIVFIPNPDPHVKGGTISRVCGKECQVRFDKERSERISASFKPVVMTESQKPTETDFIQPAVEANRRRPRPVEQDLQIAPS